jgi:hypothetical protein
MRKSRSLVLKPSKDPPKPSMKSPDNGGGSSASGSINIRGSFIEGRRNAIVSAAVSAFQDQPKKSGSLPSPTAGITFFTEVEDPSHYALLNRRVRSPPRGSFNDDEHSIYDEAENAVKNKIEQEEDGKLKIPDDMKNLSQEEAYKYFGNQSRGQFFHQLNHLQNQKSILTTNINHPMSSTLLTDLKKLEKEKQKELEEENQKEMKLSPVKVQTKIVIRTQSLNPVDNYDQMKLIQKPSNFAFDNIEEQDNEEDQDEEEEEEDERQQKSKKRMVSSTTSAFLSSSPLISRGRGVPNRDLSSPNGIGPISTQQQKRNSSVTSPNPLRLKPLSSTENLVTGGRNSIQPQFQPQQQQHRTSLVPKLSPLTIPQDSTSKPGGKKSVPSIIPPSTNAFSSLSITTPVELSEEMAMTNGAPTPSFLQDLPSLSSHPIQDQFSPSLTVLSKQEKDMHNLETLTHPVVNSSKLEFVCIDYRDSSNRKVTDRLKKGNSLFQYVEKKQLQNHPVDFYDDPYDKEMTNDDKLFEEEMNLIKSHSLLSSSLTSLSACSSPLPSMIAANRRGLNSLNSTGSSAVSGGGGGGGTGRRGKADGRGGTASSKKSQPKKQKQQHQHFFPTDSSLTVGISLLSPNLSSLRNDKSINKDYSKLSMLSPSNNHGISDAMTLSPRSHYIDNCIRQRLNPRAGLILRKQFTRELNLKHLGMGDQMAILLAEAIINVPYIESLNVRDNNLDDDGLTAIVNAVINMKDLTVLDMSYNNIGKLRDRFFCAFFYVFSRSFIYFSPCDHLVFRSESSFSSEYLSIKS